MRKLWQITAVALLVGLSVLIGPAQYPSFATTEGWGVIAQDERSLAVNILRLVRNEYHRVLTQSEFNTLTRTCLRSVIVYSRLSPCLEGLDPHTYYMPPETARELDNSRNLVGIGIGVSKSDEPGKKGVLVQEVFENGPAERAGIRADDLIVAVDGKSTEDMTIEAATSLIRGATGTSVTLTIRRSGEAQPITLSITRESIQVKSVRAKLVRNQSGAFAHIRMKDFMPNSSRDLREAILKLKQENGGKLDGVVLDLQYNPGGLVTEAANVIDMFLSRKQLDDDARVLIQFAAREAIIPDENAVFSITNDRDILDGAPILVLVNGYSASASELVAGALRKHGRAIIAGPERTYGKGTVQIHIPLSNGGKAVITMSQYLVGPRGCEYAVQGQGVRPDIYLRFKDRETPRAKFESDLENFVRPFVPNTEQCRYQFRVPQEHQTTVQKMLRALGLESAPAPQQ